METIDGFVGIQEKLNRSNENILNLQREITLFFKNGKYPVLSNDNRQVIPEAIEYHRNRVIPHRFSALSGEIIHHLRSCLDHLIWQFSAPDYRTRNEKFIEFPILKQRPPQANVFGRYERKIGGISNAYVLAQVERLQPYNRPDPFESPLLIIHDLDRIDKHRDLVLVGTTGAFEFPPDMFIRYARYQCGVPGSAPVDIASEFKSDGKIVPQIEFSNFYGRESEIVVQGLMYLHNFVCALADDFSKRFP